MPSAGGVHLIIKDAELEDLRWYLEDYLTAPYGVWEDRGPAIEAKFKPLGERLFESLFGVGRVGRDAYLTAAGSPPYEIWLASTDAAFLSLPFELMREPGKPEPPALTVAGVNRMLPGSTPALGVRHGESLRVLMVIARPQGERDAAYRSVARPLFEKVQAVAGKVTIELVRPPTFAELKERLSAAKAAGSPYDILHFDGHGVFGGSASGAAPHMFKMPDVRGFLLFEGATEQERLVSAVDFGALMDESDVPLVILNACRSGQLAGCVTPEATVATRLMQGGTAAVVAMSFAVYVRAAAEFMAAFYETLFEGETVARAVQRGRLRLRRANLRPSPKGNLPLQDWCVPVHYGRREAAFPDLKREPERRACLSLEATLDRIRTEERQAPANPRNPFAPVGGRFIGRDREFYFLEQALDRVPGTLDRQPATFNRHPVVLVHGLGGSGKTELAKAFALWLQQTGWAEFIIFHSFEPGLQTFGLDGLVSAAGLAIFGTDFIGKTEKDEDRRAIILDTLKRNRLVLVLDNFETARSMPDGSGATPPLDDAEAEQLRAFLATVAQGARSLVLVTSRNEERWLTTERDGKVALMPLELGGLDTEQVNEYADYLLAGLPKAQEHRQAPAFGELVELLDGHPLSLRLILPQLEQHTAADLIAGLKGQKQLPGRAEADSGRLGSLDACVAYSLDQLGPDAVSHLVALSMFEGVVDADVLAYMSEQPTGPKRFDGLSSSSWGALLDRAAAVGLLTTLGAGVYRLHPALPGYLLNVWRYQACVGFDAELDSTELALIEAFASFGRWLFIMIEGGEAQLAMPLIDLHRRNMGRVLGAALRRGSFRAAQNLMQPLNSFWNSCGLSVEARGWVERVQLATRGNSDARPNLETPAGELWMFAISAEAERAMYAGRLDESERAYCEIVENLGHSNSDIARRALAAAYHQLGVVAAIRGAEKDAYARYKRSLAISKALSDRHMMMNTYGELGSLARARDRPDEAERWYRESLAISEDLGAQAANATAFHALGLLATERGALADAAAWFAKSLAISKALGNQRGMINTCGALGSLALARDRLDEAERWYRVSLVLAQDLKENPTIAITYYQLGMVAQRRGTFAEAESWYRKSLEIGDGDFRLMASSYGQLGVVAQMRGHPVEALDWTVRSLDLIDEHPHRSTGVVRGNLARLTAALGMEALEVSWWRCTGKPLPENVRVYVTQALAQTTSG